MKELFGFAGILGGSFTAYIFCERFARFFVPVTGLPPAINTGIAFMVIFVAVVLVASLLSLVFTKLFSCSKKLRKVNRIGGLGFGAIKGTIIILCFATPISMLVGYEGGPPEIRDLQKIAAESWIVNFAVKIRPLIFSTFGLEELLIAIKAAARDKERTASAIIGSEAFMSVSNDEIIEEMLQRPEVRAIVEEGDLNGVLNDEEKMKGLLELADDPRFKKLLRRFIEDENLMNELRALAEGEQTGE